MPPSFHFLIQILHIPFCQSKLNDHLLKLFKKPGDSLSILAIHNLYFLTSSEWFIILSALTGSRDTPSWDSATARCTGWWSGNISLIIRGRVSMMVTMTRSQNKFGWSPFSPVTSFQTVARAGEDKKRKQASVLDSQGDAGKFLNMLLLYPMT